MQITIDTKTLNAGIATVVKALSSHAALPILEGILLTAADDGLLLKCSDLALQIECRLPAAVMETGSAVVPGRLFSEMARKLPEEEASITVFDKTLQLTCGRAKSSMQCMEAGDFPEMPFHGETYSITLPQNRFKDMIRQTVFSTAQEESKPILTGVLMELNESGLTMVALDGFRLALRRAAMQGAVSEARAAVVPAKSMNDIARTLLDTDENVTLTFTRTHVLVDMEHTKVTARLLEGDFIPYKQILPTEHQSRVHVNRKELLESIERAMLLAREGNNNLVRFSITIDQIKLFANSAIGSIDEAVPVQLTGPDIEIAFNARYFSDVLKALDDETIYLDLNNSVSPCVVRPVQGDAYYYLILPVRIFA